MVDVAEEHDLERPAPSDEPRQTLRASAAGQDSEYRFGQADLIRTIGGEAEVACERELVPTALCNRR
jgi:hypothetical protein